MKPIVFIVLLCWGVLARGEYIYFNNGTDTLRGQLLQPFNHQPARALLVFVHGDGAMTHDADGYYSVIWKPLRDAGYAVFSWDKPGTGESTGQWLSQSMADRQQEVIAAVNAVQDHSDFTAEDTGLVGFSQAGWVVPAVAADNSLISFAVGIGFARNWLEQGEYFTRVQSGLADDSPELAELLQIRQQEIDFLRQRPSYDDYLQATGDDSIDQQRYEFILKNFESDSAQDFRQITVPFLLMWGDTDLNVNACREYRYFSHDPTFADLVSLRLIPAASHAMLRAEMFNQQQMDFHHWMKLMWYEQDALAPEFMPALLRWLDQHSI